LINKDTPLIDRETISDDRATLFNQEELFRLNPNFIGLETRTHATARNPPRMLDVEFKHDTFIIPRLVPSEWVYDPLFLSPVTIYFYEQRNSSRA
jgi:hypothetical protein